MNETNDLPEVIGILPLFGSVLLPKFGIPLPILDNDLLLMIRDALSSSGYIGIIQQLDNSLFSVGTLAKIISFLDTEENHLLINLQGICRFDVIHEVECDDYRKVAVSYDRFNSDIAHEIDFAINRQALLSVLKPYLDILMIQANWEEIEQTSNDKLIATLAAVCPFAPSEKQALLEIPDLQKQSELITKLLQMAVLGRSYSNGQVKMNYIV